MAERIYLAIDLKSFYASVECAERGLDPLDTNLVVADKSRTEKTICLAVSPSLKSYGISGRARLFEVVQKMQQINSARKKLAPACVFRSESFIQSELERDSSLMAAYIAAPPRMALYMKYSTEIYKIYLKYIAPEDIHVYSVDEVFIDITPYLSIYRMTPHGIARMLISDVLKTTGITATAGIGTNLYLCKVAMDIVAKHIDADSDGVRIAELDEISYRRLLWAHKPITDFWRIGRGYSSRLASMGLYTMGDVARFSLHNENALYKAFGINAELLIDHAWGYEPCTIADIKAYRPSVKSISSGQVLECACDYKRTSLIVWEMADALSLELTKKGIVTDQLVLTVGYDVENLMREDIRGIYDGPVISDYYGRRIPKYAHGTIHTDGYTCSAKKIVSCVMRLFDSIIDRRLLVRRIIIGAGNVISKTEAEKITKYEQLDFFTDIKKEEEAERFFKREYELQQAMLEIKQKYGKNAILKASNYKEGATQKARNSRIGGHKA